MTIDLDKLLIEANKLYSSDEVKFKFIENNQLQACIGELNCHFDFEELKTVALFNNVPESKGNLFHQVLAKHIINVLSPTNYTPFPNVEK